MEERKDYQVLSKSFIHNRIERDIKYSQVRRNNNLETVIENEMFPVDVIKEIELNTNKIYLPLLRSIFKHKEAIKSIPLLGRLSINTKNKLLKKIRNGRNGRYIIKMDEIDHIKQHQGVDFICLLYRKLLDREPDEHGLNHYLNLLVSGISKDVIICSVYYSQEAREKQVTLENMNLLRKTYRMHKFKMLLKKTPIISLIYSFYSLPKLVHSIFLENRLSGMILEKYKSDLAKELVMLRQTNDLISNKFLEINQNIEKVDRSVLNGQALTEKLLDITLEKFELTKNTHKDINDLTKNYIEMNNLLHDLIVENNNIKTLLNDKDTFNTVIQAGDNLSIIRSDNFFIAIPSEEWRMVAFMNHYGYMEPGTIKAFKQLIKPGMNVVDVGANIGVFTLVAARQLELNGNVFSFEPTPRTYKILNENIQINGLLETNIIKTYNMAVMDEEKEVDFAIYFDNCGHNTLVPKDIKDQTIKVKTTSLDQCLGEIEKIDLIKIDVEGSEFLVFKGMQKIINDNPNLKIVIEFAPIHLARFNVDCDSFLDTITASGFKIRKIDEITGNLIETSKKELINEISVNLLLEKED